MGWFNAEKRNLNAAEKERQQEIKEELKKLDKQKDKEKRQVLIRELYVLEYGSEIN